MKCPYCNRAVRDMLNHLEKKEACASKHIEKLKLSFAHFLRLRNEIVFGKENVQSKGRK